MDRDVTGDEGGEGMQNCSQMSCSLRFSLAIDLRKELLLFACKSRSFLCGEYGDRGGVGKGDNCGVSPGEATGVPSSHLSLDAATLLNSTSKLFGTLPIKTSVFVTLSSSEISNDKILSTSEDDPEFGPFVSSVDFFLGSSAKHLQRLFENCPSIVSSVPLGIRVRG